MVWVGRILSCFVLCCCFEAACADTCAETLDTDSIEMVQEARSLQRRDRRQARTVASSECCRGMQTLLTSGPRILRNLNERSHQNGCGCPLVFYDEEIPVFTGNSC